MDLDPQKLLQRSISGAEVVGAVNSQNLVVPQGTEKIGGLEYDIALNSSAKSIDELNNVPVKVVNGTMIYLRDVAYVHDGASFQTNIARNDGHRGVLQVVLKHGRASTLDVVARVRAALPKIAATLPPGLEMTPLGDQSIFVRAAVNGVLREATYCRGADGGIDPALSWKLAQHARCGHLHPVVDSHLAAGHEHAGRNHQHYDLGRPGSGGGHPGG